MALARQAGRRRLAVRLATTGNGGEVVDAQALAPDALGPLLEASDLSPTPAPALLRILGNDAGAVRDIVLLTHPRSLAEPDVVEAAGSFPRGGATRIFAVSADVDPGGDVELAELRHGRPVGSERLPCRDHSDAMSPPPLGDPTRPRSVGPRGAWRGDVEPIPFPFRCGLLGPLAEPDDRGMRLVDFDAAGARILMPLRQGFLCACRVDGTDAEILPRPMLKGEVMSTIKTVVGVSGGFIDSWADRGQATPPVLIAHYDFPTRICAVHILPSFARKAGLLSWTYYADLHGLGGRTVDADRTAVHRPRSFGG